MSELYKGKYRSESARLQNWDYGSNAAYFITICTKDREYFFGEIKNGKMVFSPAGAIAHVLWYQIKNHAENIELSEFVVMPNHVHGILIVGTGHALSQPSDNETVRTGHALSPPHAPSHAPSPPHAPSTPHAPSQKSPGQNRFQNQGKNTISSIIGSYKSAVTKYCNQLELPMAWQPRFHDHIIRNDKSFQRISEYIKNNPSSWKEDKFYQ